MDRSAIPVGRTPAAFVLAGGLVAGTLDMGYACLFWALKAGVAPQRVFQSVAAGLLGRASFQGGAATATLGLLLHFVIATTMSTTYYVLSVRYHMLRTRPWAFGAAFGVLLYGIMNYVVVPLSAAGRGSRDPLWVGLSIAVHAFFIGVPIALAARRAHSA